MLSAVKILLKGGGDGGSAINSHGNTLLIMENQGKIMELCFFNFCGNPESYVSTVSYLLQLGETALHNASWHGFTSIV